MPIYPSLKSIFQLWVIGVISITLRVLYGDLVPPYTLSLGFVLAFLANKYLRSEQVGIIAGCGVVAGMHGALIIDSDLSVAIEIVVYGLGGALALIVSHYAGLLTDDLQFKRNLFGPLPEIIPLLFVCWLVGWSFTLGPYLTAVEITWWLTPLIVIVFPILGTYLIIVLGNIAGLLVISIMRFRRLIVVYRVKVIASMIVEIALITVVVRYMSVEPSIIETILKTSTIFVFGPLVTRIIFAPPPTIR